MMFECAEREDTETRKKDWVAVPNAPTPQITCKLKTNVLLKDSAKHSLIFFKLPDNKMNAIH